MDTIVIKDVPFNYAKQPVVFHSIEKDSLELATLSSKKASKIAIFYPSETYDCALPFCLEMLYQAMDMQKEKQSVILFAGRHAPELRDIYMELYFGQENFASSLFGLCYLTRSGINSLKPKGLKKTTSDKLVISNNHSALPPADLAKDISCALIVSPPYGMAFKIIDSIKWCDENRIDSVIIFDNFPTYRKIKLYARLGFAVYGWESAYIESKFSEEINNITPVSNPKTLRAFASPPNVSVVDVLDYEINKSLQSLSDSLEKIRKFSEDFSSKECIIFREASFILRKMESLVTPIHEYDESEVQTYRIEMLDRINSLIDFCKIDEETKAPAEINEIKTCLTDARSRLTSKNPKFNYLLNEIGQCANKNEKVIVFLESEQDKATFLKMLKNRENQKLFQSNIFFETLYCNPQKYSMQEFGKAIFCTYLPLSRNKLIEKISAKDKKLMLYPIEKRNFTFFNQLRAKFEGLFFTEGAREEIKRMLSDDSSPFKPPTDRYIGTINTAIDELECNLQKKKETNIISLLTDLDELIEPEPLFYDKMPLDGAHPKKELFVDCIAASLYGAGTIFLRPERTVQAVTDSDDIEYKKAEELKIGDYILLVNRQAKKTLNELILEKAEEYPKLQIIKALVNIWIHELKKGMSNSGDSETGFLRKLKDSGSKIRRSETIRYWKEGYVIGPKDMRDIERIAEIYSSSAMLSNLQGIASAIKSFRHIRQLIVRRLKNAIIEGETEEIMELGVNIEDFEQYAEIFEVASIEKRNNISIARLDTLDGNYEL